MARNGGQGWLLLSVVLSLAVLGTARAAETIKELQFAQPPESATAASRTLASLVKARDIGQTYSTGGLYLITHFGDRGDLFANENRKAIDHPMIGESWRFCSVFSTSADGAVFMGRNWDNQNVGSIIVSLYRPAGGLSSISFSRAIDVGFPLNMDLDEIRDSDLGKKLLLAPFYAMDGLNEAGLAVAIAGVRQTTHKATSREKLVFITFLIRKILDQAKNVEEAVSLAEKYVPFDLDRDSVNGHLLVADASGRSVVLEYDQDQWTKTYKERAWQAMSTRPIYGVPEATLREKCWRYRGMSSALEAAKGRLDWDAGMQILRDVKQGGTTWSAVYSLTAREVRFCVYQDWDTTFRLKPF